MKSTVISAMKRPPIFSLGDLVIGKNGVVILINSVTNEGTRFNGTIINRGASIIAVGVYEKGYYSIDYSYFNGKIELTQ